MVDPLERINECLARAKRLWLFLDYDGTLADFAPTPEHVIPDPEVIASVARLVRDPRIRVAVISGRSLEDIETVIGIPGVIYAGNHGLEMEGPGIGLFRHPDLEHFEGKVVEIADSLRGYAKGGAWIEEKGPTLTFHTHDLADEERGEVLEEVRQLIRESGFVSREVYSCVEARPPIGWDKGRAVLHILRSRYGPAWSEHVRVIYAGDDQTDEDAFRFLAGLATTFRVGGADTLTAAARRLPDVEAVRALLEWLGRRTSPSG